MLHHSVTSVHYCSSFVSSYLIPLLLLTRKLVLFVQYLTNALDRKKHYPILEFIVKFICDIGAVFYYCHYKYIPLYINCNMYMAYVICNRSLMIKIIVVNEILKRAIIMI